MKITTVGIIGSGTMGSGITQVIVQSGFQVILYDIGEDVLSRAKNQIESQINKLLNKGRLKPSEADQAKERIYTTTDLTDMRSCELVIEAAPEVMEIKKKIFSKLHNYCREETIFASNTSSFSITEIAGNTSLPERVAGLHFFNPAPIMPLVEVIRGLKTTDQTIGFLMDFVHALNKSPVTCQDTPGFIVNRIARPFYNEALRVLGDQVASVEQIDRIMKKAGRFRMGPFELQDFIGIDVNFSTTESLYEGFSGDPRFRPHFYQQRMVQSGRLGRKSGGGYYDYGE